MKLLLDEMLPADIAERLRKRGHDVLAVAERAELKGMSDPDLFARAQQEQRAVVTCNRDDFLSLDRLYRGENRVHHGIVIINPRRFPQRKENIGRLITALDTLIESGPPYPVFVHWLQ